MSINNLEEQPVIISMLKSESGKSIIDLGCGYGDNCKTFANMGFKRVVGIDISEKMLEVAKSTNQAQGVEFIRLPMEDIGLLNEKFDVIISSLAFHYVDDLTKLVKDIYSRLNKEGVLIFSQEHPLTTAPITGSKWINKSDGSVDHYALRDYSVTGQRKVKWIVDNVTKYHRTFSDIINALAFAGFKVAECKEPFPGESIAANHPYPLKSIHKPNFLIIKAKKT